MSDNEKVTPIKWPIKCCINGCYLGENNILFRGVAPIIIGRLPTEEDIKEVFEINFQRFHELGEKVRIPTPLEFNTLFMPHIYGNTLFSDMLPNEWAYPINNITGDLK